MNIYSVGFDAENYQRLGPVNESDLDGGNLWINGTLKGASWQPVEMAYTAKEHEHETTADITYISPGFYAFNRRAVNALEDILKANGELLPLPVDGELLQAFNPHNEIDCFDDERAEYNVRRNGKRGTRLLKPAFNGAKISDDTALFQVGQFLNTRFFVTDVFKDAYKAARLTGLVFEKAQ